MRHFQLIGSADVLPVMMALQQQPDLWNEHRFRTTYTGTPHTDVDDILLRFSAPDRTADPALIDGVINDTAPVFYPAWHALPQVRLVVFDLMRRMEAVALGRVIISRLKPGGVITAHADADGAYTEQLHAMRLHVALQGEPGSLYHCGGETVNMRTGQVWWFDHKAVHAVENNSADDRIHLMIDLERAP
jgi:hypothetical protein